MATPETAVELLREADRIMRGQHDPVAWLTKYDAYLRAHDAASVQPDAQVEGQDWKAKYEAADGAVQRLKNILDGHSWLAEGRGSYRYDDGRYDDEVMVVFRELLDACDESHWEPWQTVLSRLREYEWKERNAASQAPATDALRGTDPPPNPLHKPDCRWYAARKGTRVMEPDWLPAAWHCAPDCAALGQQQEASS